MEIWTKSTSSTPNCVDQKSGAVTKLKPAAHNREVLVTCNNLHLLKWAMTWHRSALLFDSQASARPQHHARSDFESVFVGFCCPKRWSRVWVQYCQGATEDSPKQFPVSIFLYACSQPSLSDCRDWMRSAKLVKGEFISLNLLKKIIEETKLAKKIFIVYIFCCKLRSWQIKNWHRRLGTAISTYSCKMCNSLQSSALNLVVIESHVFGVLRKLGRHHCWSVPHTSVAIFIVRIWRQSRNRWRNVIAAQYRTHAGYEQRKFLQNTCITCQRNSFITSVFWSKFVVALLTKQKQ